MDVALELYGRYFVKYAMDMGYDTMLRALGPDVRCFIENIDTVHTLLAISYHNIVPPIFRYKDTSIRLIHVVGINDQ